MRIRFQMEGGIAYFPGLNKPIEVDSETLPAQESNALKQMLAAAHFFDLPTEVNPPPHGADQRQYTITVEDDKRIHTVRLTDPIENPNLQALVAYMQAKRQVPS
jgi:hypothetical protein